MGWIWPGLPPSSAPVKLFHADPGVIELGHSTWALPGTCEPGTCLTPEERVYEKVAIFWWSFGVALKCGEYRKGNTGNLRFASILGS